MDVEQITNEMNTLEAEVEILDKLTDTDTVTVKSDQWDYDTALYLSRDDVQALIDRRVERLNELDHELREIEG